MHKLRAARASCGSPRPAGAAAAPPRSPRSGVIEVFVPARRRGTLHQPRTPVSGAMAVGLKKKLGFNAWRPHQISPCTSSARLALPAEARALRARRLRRPARRARRPGGDWVKQGLRPRPPSGDTSPEPPFQRIASAPVFAFPRLRAARASCGSPRQFVKD